MIAFFDASAMVKRYAVEAGTELVRGLLAEGVAISRLTEVEAASALCRRHDQGDFDALVLGQLLAALDRDLARARVIEVSSPVVARARALLLRHRLRASEAVQLASALDVQAELAAAVKFVCFDARLTAAAAREGLRLA